MKGTLPPGLAAELEQALERALGGPTPIERAEPVSGGCVNPSARITTRDGGRWFVKWNPAAPPGLCELQMEVRLYRERPELARHAKPRARALVMAGCAVGLALALVLQAV